MLTRRRLLFWFLVTIAGALVGSLVTLPVFYYGWWLLDLAHGR